ncbi:MAG: hypothetical protein IPH28_18435 [Cytophagaceae bacterium]|nr:hypothetical protein [Cytophagaceae bacterium]MBK9509659.1 hypothetical protein [Cytophagaceae bacterium]MBK9936235.1 hypothetical protein [Cytophagaceae bacterium]MBL0303872.1 hypothetical protein [Cytophagaceae bacterium]
MLERLKEFIVYKNFSIRKFETILEIGNGTISRAIKYSKEIGSDKIAKICKLFPDLNPIWLITGRGQMLNTSEPNILNEPEEVYGLDKNVEQLLEIIELQKFKIRKLEEELKKK